MKSLEIVNEKIRKHEKRIIDIQPIEEYIKGLHIIKQDLEVLEILRNKTKYILEDEVDRFEIFSLDEKISKEEYNKVKQWLEVNE